MLTRGSHAPGDDVAGRGAAYAVSIRFASYHAALLVIRSHAPTLGDQWKPEAFRSLRTASAGMHGKTTRTRLSASEMVAPPIVSGVRAGAVERFSSSVMRALMRALSADAFWRV